MVSFGKALKSIFTHQSRVPSIIEANKMGRALIEEAFKENPDTQKMRKLILKGANVNITNADGFSPLLIVAGRKNFSEQDSEDLCRTLVAAGADINLKTESGNTALIWALRINRTKLAKFLIKQGADIHAVNSKDESGFSIADRFSYTDVLKAMQAASPSANNIKI